MTRGPRQNPWRVLGRSSGVWNGGASSSWHITIGFTYEMTLEKIDLCLNFVEVLGKHCLELSVASPFSDL